MPQHYMFGAMNLVRSELEALVRERLAGTPALEPTRGAVGKILDLELAIMLHTYREDLLAQQARVERLSTFGQLVGSIGHDLRNPLGVIETSLHILRGRIGGDEKALKHAERIREQVGQANGIISNLLDMIRDRPLEPPGGPPRRARGRGRGRRGPAAGGLARPTTGSRGCRWSRAIRSRSARCSSTWCRTPSRPPAPAGAVVVRGRREGASVHLQVEDDGPGVAPSIRRRLFEPLITTKAHGVGLGLALVKRIAEQHGGAVAYGDREGGGACFTLQLPAPPEAP